MVAEKLRILHGLPRGMERLAAPELHSLLGGPTLIEISGEREQPVFVSVLLHGNETGGWEAVRRLLASLEGRAPKRTLCLFLGNVEAAYHGVRHLPDQPDFNRVWNGGPDHPLVDVARLVTEHMRARGCFASVDIHNNSGVNPFHVCVAALDSATLRVASLFSPITVLIDYPASIQSAAFADFCPAVTLEAGRPGDAQGISQAAQMLEAVLSIESIEDIEVDDGSHAWLYTTKARIELPASCDFEFTRLPLQLGSADITLSADMELRNFEHLPAGTPFASVPADRKIPLSITSRQGEIDVDRYFARDGSQVRLARDVILSMYTSDARSVRQDCLCYVMEPIELHPASDECAEAEHA